MKSCSTCAHIARQWSEQPCVSCQQGEERGNWEPVTEGRSGDGLARRLRASPAVEDGKKLGHTPALPQKARRRAIAREWSTYLGVKIRARHVKAMQRLADDVEGGE